MHAALFTVSIKGGVNDARIKNLHDNVVPMVSSAPGFVAGYWLDSVDDHGFAFVVFEDEASAKACGTPGRCRHGRGRHGRERGVPRRSWRTPSAPRGRRAAGRAPRAGGDPGEPGPTPEPHDVRVHGRARGGRGRAARRPRGARGRRHRGGRRALQRRHGPQAADVGRGGARRVRGRARPAAAGAVDDRAARQAGDRDACSGTASAAGSSCRSRATSASPPRRAPASVSPSWTSGPCRPGVAPPASPARSGRAHALDLILRAKKIDGPTALAIGLVHEVHPVAELKARAVELAEELAAQPPIAVAGVLRAVVDGERLPLDEALRTRARRGAALQRVGRPGRGDDGVPREAPAAVRGPLGRRCRATWRSGSGPGPCPRAGPTSRRWR